jgi:hypothetical protein
MADDDDLNGAVWFKSSHSPSGSASCVEVAFLGGGTVAVRDTKDQGSGPILRFTGDEWAAFIRGAQDGEFAQPV